jgi:hypothetical protein
MVLEALFQFLTHWWPVITIVAALLPSPIAKARIWISKILPKAWSAALLAVNAQQVAAIIAHLAQPGGSHDTAVSLLVSLTANTANPMSPAVADWVVIEIQNVFRARINTMKAYPTIIADALECVERKGVK